MAGIEEHYSARDIETRILTALREAGLDPDQRLTPEELGALDHFHTGGYNASLRLLQLAQIQAGDRVLDIGAGLAGPARMLAVNPGCDVDCIELSRDYCTGAALLNRITGLEDRVAIYEGSALEQPFNDDVFDAAWMQNVGMNIEDKRGLYEEVYRVLKPGGRFVFQEMAAGDTDTSYFPLPWATDPSDNFLVSIEEMHSLLGECGFVPEFFEDVNNAPKSGTPDPPPKVELSLSVYVDDLAHKAENAMRSVSEGQIRFVRGLFRADK
jgi:sarcosine/dimethylglycine N-methyltransferase